MVIVIDAYNYIKHVSATSFVPESEIIDWIDRFKEYADKRHNQVILVFDAGPGDYKSSDRFGDVIVMYSGQMQSADDVIKDWLSDRRGQDILLVTSDREICDYANRIDIVSVGSQDFYRIFEHVMGQEEEYEQQVAQAIHKTTEQELEGLDKLMEVGSRNLVKEQIHRDETMDIRVRNGKKASREDKRLLRKIEKI